MRDLNKLFENRVKDAVAKTAMALGIDKADVFYGIGGFGAIGPLIGQNSESGEQAFLGFQPVWNLQMGLRSPLVNTDPIIGGVPIPGVFPAAAEVEFVVKRLLEELQQLKDGQNSVSKLEIAKR